MYLENSKTDFDGWSELTVVATLSHDDANFATLIGKSNYAGWMDNNKIWHGPFSPIDWMEDLIFGDR